MATIIEALENAEYNLGSKALIARELGINQLHNAIGLLDRGYGIYDEVEPLLEKYGHVDNVPTRISPKGREKAND